MTTRNTTLRVVTGAAVLLVAFVFTSCGSSEADGTVSVLSPKEAAALLHAEDRVVIDVRTAEAHRAGHVRGAVSLPLRSGELEAQLPALDPEQPYFVYSGDGTDASRAADLMVDAGIDDVVDGGSFGLLAIAGAPVE